jgi:eukaryotic-like serine/threonine-protein kinase
LIATARQTAETVDLVRLQRKLQVVNADGEASKGASARPSAGSATPPEELGSIEAVLASAIARARDLSAQASLEGTVTILFSDIEDSSSLYEKLGDLRAHDVIRVHNEIFRQQIAAHRGVEVKALGDSFMVAFSSARRGPCARSRRSVCSRPIAGTHPELPIRVRMGLHVGEAINESADYFGKAVIFAARLATLAEGGQILVSSTFHDLTANAGDLRFALRGETQLKGLAGTHQIFEVVW